MTVYELRELFIDDAQLVRLYNLDSEEYIFEGNFYDLPTEYEDYEVLSIDNLYKENFDGYIVINI